MTPPRPSRPARRRRWPWVVLGVVIILLAIPLVFPRIQSALLRAEVARQSADALAAHRDRADTDHAEFLTRMQQMLHIEDRQPVYGVVHVVCWTDHNDSGWMATSYNRTCEYNYIDVFEAPDNPEVSRLVAQPDPLYVEQGKPFSPFDITRYLKPFKEGDNWKDLWLNQVFVTSSALGADARGVIDEWIVGDSVVAYAITEAFEGRKLVAESGNPQLDPARPYLVLVHDHEVYKRNLGCAFPQILFCVDPLGGD